MSDKLNDILAQGLSDLDVEVMFGVLGDANMYIVDSFCKNHGGRFVASANEGGAVLMAAGYAAVTGEVGVATVTHGAIANCVSALFDAVRGRYPVLVLAGDTARKEAYHLQNIPQREVIAPTGAGYREVRGLETVVADVAAALTQARAERRPVVIDIPSDFQQAATEAVKVARSTLVSGVSTPSMEDLEDAAGLILSSNRPLVLAGRGAGWAGTPQALTEFAERIGVPVATTLRGKGVFNEDPYHLGVYGTLANPVGTEVIAKADCVIAFGASISALTALRGELLQGKRVIQIDSDPASIGRRFPVDIGIAADAATTARMLMELFDIAEAPAGRGRSDALRDRLSEWRRQDREEALGTEELNLTGVLYRVNDIIPSHRSLTVDGGRFSHEALRILDVERPQNYAYCLNVGHIGLGVGYGIGAAVGRPDAPALVVVGDGGFMLGGLQEFNTAVRHNANLVVILLNDRAYGAEYYRFVHQSLDPTITTFDWPGFAELADALGGTGVRIDDWSGFDRLEELVAAGQGPILAEVMLDVATIPDPGEH